MNDRQNELNKNVEVLKELLTELSNKYNCYITIFCFPGFSAIANDPVIENE